MAATDRPLWHILILTVDAEKGSATLSCSECFALLEFLAEEAAATGKQQKQRELWQKIKTHLQYCPDCKAYYWQRLQEMENYQQDLEKKEKNCD